jgi:ribosomal protein S27AE
MAKRQRNHNRVPEPPPPVVEPADGDAVLPPNGSASADVDVPADAYGRTAIVGADGVLHDVADLPAGARYDGHTNFDAAAEAAARAAGDDAGLADEPAGAAGDVVIDVPPRACGRCGSGDSEDLGAAAHDVIDGVEIARQRRRCNKCGQVRIDRNSRTLAAR